MKNEIQFCIKCKKEPVYIKKRQLCRFCYGRLVRQEGRLSLIDRGEVSHRIAQNDQQKREVQFIKNYFRHNNWHYSPALFHLNGENYTPDFYDGEKNVFIEVAGTRQAYFFNKFKYDLMRQLYPKINFEIRRPDGELLDETQPINSQL